MHLFRANQSHHRHMKHYLLLFFIPLIYLPCHISNETLIHLTREDGPYEYAGAILFLFTAIVFAILAAKPGLFKGKRRFYKYPEKRYYLLFMVLFFFAFGEEISWGQRIFNFEAPETLKELNVQGEFNLHNLEIFHGNTRDGGEKEGLVALLSMHRLFYAFLLSYLFVIPLCYNFSARIRTFLDKTAIPTPNIIFGVLFIFNMLYGNLIERLNPDLKTHGIIEIKEVVIALIIFAFSLSLMNLERMRKIREN